MPSFYSTLFKRDIDFPETEPKREDMVISNLDVDITEKCTLRCSYCFKGKLSLRREMSLDTAKQLIRWLVKYSGDQKDIHVTFLGGEPMLGFDVIKKWMPYAKNYCAQRNKSLGVGITTNMTVFTEEHLKIFRFWHIGIHSSIDGIPEVQDACRVFPDGGGSSKTVEANLPRIFRAWRTTHARSTIVPETVQHLAESFEYFLEKGFLKVAFSLAQSDKWNQSNHLETLKKQISEMLIIHLQKMKEDNKFYSLTMVDDFFRKEGQPRQKHHCGAGRGLLHVDVEGFLWPCHRYNSGLKPSEELLVGHINGGFHPGRRRAFINIVPGRDIKAPCSKCECASFCGCPCIAANWQENGDFFNPGEGYCKAKRIMYRQIKKHIEQLKKNEPDFYKQLKDWVFNYKW